jgi:hypothetical protein
VYYDDDGNPVEDDEDRARLLWLQELALIAWTRELLEEASEEASEEVIVPKNELCLSLLPTLDRPELPYHKQ